MDISQYTKTNLLSTKLSTEFYTAETTGSMLTALSGEIYDSIDDLTATYDAAGAAATAEQNAKNYTDDKIDDLTAVYDAAGAAAQAEAAAKSYAETLTAFYDVAGAAANALTAAKAYTDTAITNLVDGAPEVFDTLKEIADWISADESGLTALTSRITALETDKADKTELTAYALSSDVSSIADLKADKSELTAYVLSADLSATLETVEDLVDRHSVLTTNIETLATNGSISTAAIITKVNEIIGLLNAHLTAGSSESYSGYIPVADPLRFKVTDTNNHEFTATVTGPSPAITFYQTTGTSESAVWSANGVVKFVITDANEFDVVADSAVGQNSSLNYQNGDVIATIARPSLVPTNVNGTFEWLPPEQP